MNWGPWGRLFDVLPRSVSRCVLSLAGGSLCGMLESTSRGPTSPLGEHEDCTLSRTLGSP